MTRQLGLRIGRWLKDRLLSSGRAVCELFYPRICTVCGESLMKGEVYLCTACLADFPFSDQAYAIQEDVLLNFDAAYRPEKLFSLFYYNKFSPYKNLFTGLNIVLIGLWVSISAVCWERRLKMNVRQIVSFRCLYIPKGKKKGDLIKPGKLLVVWPKR